MSVTFPTQKIKNSWLPEANSKLMEVTQCLPVRKEASFIKQLRAPSDTLCKKQFIQLYG